MTTTDRLLTLGLLNTYAAFDEQTLSIGIGTVGVLTAPSNARYALITVEGATTSTLRFWSTGTAPTTDNGFLIGNGGAFDIEGAEAIARTKIYAKENCTLQIQYYR